ncbi:LysE family translocator [Microbulbifer sp. OS29]|uniref:LysE family translocator n=2 Tax=Microbulbifer okhotskensis TaxID=2926617 RepID=A0A9X2ENQ6_9GAMM|nr:LysE family translocator [Microbulbifer okhotskensis]
MGSIYITYIGFRIATASIANVDINAQEKPQFLQGFLLQWLNPKAWVACISGVALFISPENHSTLFTFILVYFLVCYVSLTAWAIAGDRIGLLLGTKGHRRIFNRIMGGVLILCAISLLYSQLFAHNSA